MDQERIWDHFQTTRVDAFEHARGRYVAMAAEARRRRGGDGGRVLNIGIGPGRLEQLLKVRGWSVAALDPSPKAAEALLPLDIDARCGYAEQMPFDSATFDVVIASEVLEHIEPGVRAAVLPEIARVLRPGGWFIGSVPYREVLADQEVICPDCGKVFHRWGHVSSFDIPQLRGELDAVFTTTACRRRAFVDWQAARTPGRLFKAVVQAALGRMGEGLVSPSILFTARNGSGH